MSIRGARARFVAGGSLALLGIVLLSPFIASGQIDDVGLVSRYFDEHTAIMLLIDPEDGAIVDANQRATSFYGMTLEELRSTFIQDINAYSPEKVAELRSNAAAFERNFFVFPHHTKHHGVRSVAVYSSPVDLPSGQRFLLSIVHDVTDHQLETSEARAYRAELEDLVDRSLQEVVAQRERRILID
ncbi:MAG TPA: PAS domain-containing protein, partial [Wenzhouxiangella sp.]|nr:PAS domain-containing protein [Wenzhouxiangella sp.]